MLARRRLLALTAALSAAAPTWSAGGQTSQDNNVTAASVVMNATASAPSDMENQRDCTALARIFSTGERFVGMGVGDSCIRPRQAIGRPKYAYKRASHKPPYGRRFLVNARYTSASISLPCSSSHARLA